MLKNDVLRRLRYILKFNDEQMVDVFNEANFIVTKDQILAWLKKDDETGYVAMKDSELASFLNGHINKRRGKRDGDESPPEEKLTNNMILKKLMISFSFKTDDVIEVLNLVDFRLGKHELSAFFRKADHKNYRECKAQVLRNFLNGLIVYLKNKSEKQSKESS